MNQKFVDFLNDLNVVNNKLTEVVEKHNLQATLTNLLTFQWDYTDKKVKAFVNYEAFPNSESYASIRAKEEACQFVRYLVENNLKYVLGDYVTNDGTFVSPDELYTLFQQSKQKCTT